MTAQHDPNTFGALLKSWRQIRRLSQLDLALSCGISQRHMSFMESGRSRPSRGMALTLGSVLRMPLKEQNLMLLAAGFAPAFAERASHAPPRARVDAALLKVIELQNPLPAILLESHRRIVAANAAAEHLFMFLLDHPRTEDDLGRLFTDDDGIGRHLDNIADVLACQTGRPASSAS